MTAMTKKPLALIAVVLVAATLAGAATGLAADRKRGAASARVAYSVQLTSLAILKLKLKFKPQRRLPVPVPVKLR
jgi:hypothetical protein